MLPSMPWMKRFAEELGVAIVQFADRHLFQRREVLRNGCRHGQVSRCPHR